MKVKLFFSIAVLLFTNSLFCQKRIHYKDVQVYNNGDVIASVFAQNIGGRTKFMVPYGARWQMSNVSDDKKSFSIKYKYIPNGYYRKEIPSSVTVKLIFDQYTEMEHFYEMQSTGTAGENWRVIFTNIPLESENVKIDILGWEYFIGDLPLAEKARKERDIKVKNLIAEGNKFEKKKDYKNAIISYTDAIKLDDSKLKFLSPKVSFGFFNLAEKDFDNKNYESAIENYVLCINADNSYQTKISNNYAEALFQTANNYYKNSEYTLASDMFKNAIKIDNSIKAKVDSHFQSIRINKYSNMAFSSIPGLFQIYRGNTTIGKISQIFNGKITEDNLQATKGLLMFGSFTVFSFVSYSAYSLADDYYKLYGEAITETDASNYFDQTISSQNTGHTFFTLSIATVMWSIYDSNKWVKWHNEKFTLLNNEKLSTIILPRLKKDQLLLSLVFEF